jgi:glycosyltransferase involved in cell wall biosynthesis
VWCVLSIIIPASNEAGYIGPCLAALLASDPVHAELIVVANGCRDTTAAVACGFADAAAARGWRLVVHDLATGSKPSALNAGDAAAKGDMRLYLDADIIVTPPLLAQIVAALGADAPTYAGATPRIPAAHSRVTRAYARFWQTLPFARSTAPGFGLFAVNAAGRARWGTFPAIIADDTFVRLQFAPHERIQVPATYDWPMIEGFAALTRVRRRQNAGMAEIAALYPALLPREDKAPVGLGGVLARGLRDPMGFATYAAVSLAVRLRKGGTGFIRGR